MSDDEDLTPPPGYADLDAYEARVAELLDGPPLPRVLGVHCAGCPGRGRPLGSVVESPDGLLLVVREDPPIYGTAGSITPSEARALTGQRAGGRSRGWIISGPNTYAARFEHLRPADEDDVPAVTCPTHGRLTPDLGGLVAAIRSGRRAAGVAADGRVVAM